MQEKMQATVHVAVGKMTQIIIHIKLACWSLVYYTNRLQKLVNAWRDVLIVL